MQVDEQDPFLPPSAASQAIAARTLRNQGSYNAPPSSTSSLKRLPSPRNVVEPSPSMSHRYTPLNHNPFALNLPNETKDFQKYLKSTSNVYYDPNISDSKRPIIDERPEMSRPRTEILNRDFSLSFNNGPLNSTMNAASNYEYYSSIPVNSNLTSLQRGWNYSNRDNEFLSPDSQNLLIRPNDTLNSQNSTLESSWSPSFEK